MREIAALLVDWLIAYGLAGLAMKFGLIAFPALAFTELHGAAELMWRELAQVLPGSGRASANVGTFVIRVRVICAKITREFGL